VAQQPLLATAISCGGMHTAAVTSAGHLYCWGRADNGQLGIGRQWLEAGDPACTGVGESRVITCQLLYGIAPDPCGRMIAVTPVLVQPGCFDSPVKQVGAHMIEAASLQAGGASLHQSSAGVRCLTPRVSQVSCGAFHTAVVTVAGSVYTWGREEHGMLGHDVPPDNFYDAQDRPKIVDNMGQLEVRGVLSSPTGLEEWRVLTGRLSFVGVKGAESVSCGGWHTVIVTKCGKLFTCGRGEYGRLGVGDQTSHLTLTPVDALAVRRTGARDRLGVRRPRSC
jgi:regulator of chromosome condensation